ncbi:MAG: nucleotidyltransferase domain-containing protein [Verrucomicrobiota bacterium]
MNFLAVIDQVTSRLDAADIRYALIGGFAMALRGVQRATVDLDFILMLDDLNHADAIFREAGYTRAFRNENVSHYISKDTELGRIDILHAFRGPTLSMLDRADRLPIDDRLSLPVVQMEDIIGLKIQSARNDPSRSETDWQDIHAIIAAASEARKEPDWRLLKDYLDIFRQTDKLQTLKNWYGPTH